MADDRAIFRQVRRRGLAGFRQAYLEPRQHDAIRRVLDFLEELSEDMNNGKVDSKLIYAAMGSSLRRAWERTEAFISSQREETGNRSFMINLEEAYHSYVASPQYDKRDTRISEEKEAEVRLK